MEMTTEADGHDISKVPNDNIPVIGMRHCLSVHLTGFLSFLFNLSFLWILLIRHHHPSTFDVVLYLEWYKYFCQIRFCLLIRISRLRVCTVTYCVIWWRSTIVNSWRYCYLGFWVMLFGVICAMKSTFVKMFLSLISVVL